MEFSGIPIGAQNRGFGPQKVKGAGFHGGGGG